MIGKQYEWDGKDYVSKTYESYVTSKGVGMENQGTVNLEKGAPFLANKEKMNLENG